MPVPSFLELGARDKVRYIAFSQGQLAELRLAKPLAFLPAYIRHCCGTMRQLGSTTSLWRTPTCPTTSSIKWSGQSSKTKTK